MNLVQMATVYREFLVIIKSVLSSGCTSLGAGAGISECGQPDCHAAQFHLSTQTPGVSHMTNC